MITVVKLTGICVCVYMYKCLPHMAYKFHTKLETLLPLLNSGGFLGDVCGKNFNISAWNRSHCEETAIVFTAVTIRAYHFSVISKVCLPVCYRVAQECFQNPEENLAAGERSSNGVCCQRNVCGTHNMTILFFFFSSTN